MGNTRSRPARTLHKACPTLYPATVHALNPTVLSKAGYWFPCAMDLIVLRVPPDVSFEVWLH